MHKILLAEDDNDMRRFLVKALENAGFEVSHHDNGMSAYQRLREEPLIGRQAVVMGRDLKTGVFQRLDQKTAHIVVIFGKEDFMHGGRSSNPVRKSSPLTKPDRE